MAKATSKRTTQWRKSKEQQGFKQVSVYLQEQTIKQLELLQKQKGVSRADVITTAVEQLEHISNTTETNSSVHGTDRHIHFLEKQIEEKDHQINGLVESTKQANMLLAGLQKGLGLLEAPKEPVHQQNIKTGGKKKGKKSKKGKGKRKNNSAET